MYIFAAASGTWLVCSVHREDDLGRFLHSHQCWKREVIIEVLTTTKLVKQAIKAPSQSEMTRIDRF